MSSLFGKSKTPEIQTAPPETQVETIEEDNAPGLQAERRRAASSSYAKTIFAGSNRTTSGPVNAPGSKTVLG